MSEPVEAPAPPVATDPPPRRPIPPVLKELDRAMARTVDAWTRFKKAPPESQDAAKRVIDDAELRLKEAWAKFEAEAKARAKGSEEEDD